MIILKPIDIYIKAIFEIGACKDKNCTCHGDGKPPPVGIHLAATTLAEYKTFKPFYEYIGKSICAFHNDKMVAKYKLNEYIKLLQPIEKWDG